MSPMFFDLKPPGCFFALAGATAPQGTLQTSGRPKASSPAMQEFNRSEEENDYTD
jgi:hypothetical protein